MENSTPLIYYFNDGIPEISSVSLLLCESLSFPSGLGLGTITAMLEKGSSSYQLMPLIMSRTNTPLSSQFIMVRDL